MSIRSALILVILGVAAQTGCSTRPPTGDARGGTIDWYASTKAQIAASADAHCARYGKKGRVTNIESDRAGGEAVFVCE